MARPLSRIAYLRFSFLVCAVFLLRLFNLSIFFVKDGMANRISKSRKRAHKLNKWGSCFSLKGHFLSFLPVEAEEVGGLGGRVGSEGAW